MAHSPHFRELFTNPAAEEFETGVVHEKALPQAVLDVMIYCYFGGFLPTTAEEDEGMAVPMFKLADKFGVDGMKDRLVGRLSRRHSVMEMVALADSHSADGLKQVGGVGGCVVV